MNSIKWKSVLVGVCLFIGITIPIYQVFTQHNLQKRETEQNLLKTYKNTIILNIKHRYNYVRILHTVLNANSHDFSALAPVAKELLKNKSCLYVSILENESITAFFSDATNVDMVGKPLSSLDFAHYLAISVADTVIEGPLYDPLVDAQVFLIVQPVYQNDKYIGQIAVAVDAMEVINSFDLQQLVLDRFDYELWRINPNNGSKNIISQSNKEVFFSDAQEIKMEFPCIWKLTIVRSDRWFSIVLFIGLIFLIFSIAVLAAFFTHSILLRKKLATDMKENDLYDSETKFLNKEGFLKHIQDILETDKDNIYQLVFLKIKNYDDITPLISKKEKLDYFTFFIESIDNFIEKEYVVGRISESSFAILIFDDISINDLYHLEKGLSLELLHKLSLKDRKIILPVGCGSSKFPNDGLNADDILVAAIEDYQVRFPPVE